MTVRMSVTPRNSSGDLRFPLWVGWSEDRVTCHAGQRDHEMVVGDCHGDLRLTSTLVDRSGGSNIGRVNVGDQIEVDGVLYVITEDAATFPLIRV
jgi:hypothetical protein